MLPVTIPDDNCPATLRELCTLYCVRNTQTFSTYDERTKKYSLKEGVSLPPEICESLVHAYESLGKIIDDNFMHIFKDHIITHLRQINVQDSNVTGAALKWLIRHRLTELNISGCADVTNETLRCINEHGKFITKLFIGNSIGILDGINFEEIAHHTPSDHGDSDTKIFGLDYIFDCPQVRAFSIHDLDRANCPAYSIIKVALKPFSKLAYLDLSNCNIDLELIDSWDSLRCLTTLILYNVPLRDLDSSFKQIVKLKTLRSLDLSQANRETYDPVMYTDPDENLAFLVSNLPCLVNLDLSGTNLPGFPKAEEVSHRLEATRIDGENNKNNPCPITGLKGRHFEFLGLLNCPHDPCHREGLPADRISGEFTAAQVICACQVNLEKRALLLSGLHHLSEVFKHLSNYDKISALKAVLNAMRRYANDHGVQMSASACLFFLMRDQLEERTLRNVHIRKILHALFDAMENHANVRGVRRNCIMTLLNMEFPDDVIKDHKRLFRVMLKMIKKFEQSGEDSLEKKSFHVLNNMAVEVDLKEKETFGDFGGIQAMLDIIKKRIVIDEQNYHGHYDDDRIEDAWTVLWNYSDETPKNCERFLDGGGMDLFIQCFKSFPNRHGLMRNMMGLMGNVAEVKYLRPRLMIKEYIEVYTQMLPIETQDGIELNYHACGVLAHIMSDGQEAWRIPEPERETVSKTMARTITRWSVAAKRHINYRSFKPLLRLVPLISSPISQHWAVWALRNLVGEYRQKYCELLHSEGGLTLLHKVVSHPEVTEPVKNLAVKTLEICRYYFDDDRLGTEEEEDPPPLEL